MASTTTAKARPVTFMSEKNTLRFISIIKNEGKCIWDPDDDYYNNRVNVLKAWAKISEETGVKVDVLKVKWKNLRDLFRRELRKYKITSLDGYRGSWKYLKPLWFIRKSLRATRKTQLLEDEKLLEEEKFIEDETIDEADFVEDENDEVHGDDDENGVGNDDRDDTNNFFMKIECQTVDNYMNPTDSQIFDAGTDPIQNMNDTNTANNSGNAGNSKQDSEEDYDEMFLRSLLPYFRHLELMRKLNVRRKIMELLATEIENQSIVYTRNS